MKKDLSPSPRIKSKFHFDTVYYDNPCQFDSLTLYQVGDCCCESGSVMWEHKQICYEISYIVSGKGNYSTNGTSYPVKEGDIYLNPPGTIHNYKADMIDPFRFFYIGFIFNEQHPLLDQFNHIKIMFDKVDIPITADKYNIKNVFLNIFNELINLKSFSNTMLNMHINEIIILTYRNFFENWDKIYSPQKSSNHLDNITYEIINYIDTNLCNIDKVTEIADKIGYSYSYIAHIFSQKTGLSIKQYYNKKRFEKAVEWLKYSSMSITDISLNLNFQTIHSFSKTFHKHFGISPSDYREIYKENLKYE